MGDRLVARIADHIAEHLEALTLFTDRRVGGPGNRAATAYVAERTATWGLTVRRTEFTCLDWEPGEATLRVGRERHTAHVGPYSPACSVVRPLAQASTLEQLESDAIRGTVLLLHGEIAREQVMPKNFPFYNPEEHRRIVSALEANQPAAVVAATGRDPDMAGGPYPFPLFDDGDLDIPSAYITDVEGARLLSHLGEEVGLDIVSRRFPATAEHVVAVAAGAAPGRVVVFAHIDSKTGSPGALDNAAGVATLLGLAELMAGSGRGPSVEFVPLNGEDHYANPGELHWLAENEGRLADVVLGINIDGVGRRDQTTEVSLYGCPPELERLVRRGVDDRPGLREGPPWYQGDHMLFGIGGRPAIAVTSSDAATLMAEHAHTTRDTVDLVDPSALADAAVFARDLIESLGGPA